jgi:hypothetical protein
MIAFTLALSLGALSCATSGYVPETESMPAARAGLAPEERFFYDALIDYGDWTLIEPWGWVFRPRVNIVAWHPFQNGFWVPSEFYGWTWISTEPFGWATYHYGEWAYDSFQGWVWIPGMQWGPAWVDWREGDGYIGWAPSGPNGGNFDQVPGGPYLYVPISQFPSTDVGVHVQTAYQLRDRLGMLTPIENVGEHEGVRFNRGPEVGRVEQAVGRPLPLVKLDEKGVVVAPASEHAKAMPPGHTHADSVASVKQQADEAMREARDITASKAPAPPHIKVMRPFKKHPPKQPASEAEKHEAGAGGAESAPHAAKRDSTR